MSHATLYCGDALAVLQTLPAESVQCVVTSPPYWGLRDYGTVHQLGLERTPEEYAEKMVAVFREVWRVLRNDGTLWLNLGDSYAGSRGGPNGDDLTGRHEDFVRSKRGGSLWGYGDNAVPNLKPKDLVGIPWRLAFALQADGWYLRSDIIWAKPNAMPESVRDRPTKAHEYLFLIAKSERYYYDAAAVAEQQASATVSRARYGWHGCTDDGSNGSRTGSSFRAMAESDGPMATIPKNGFRNARTVWEIATQPYPEAHFATFPEELARRCILAGSRPGDTVLDPFGGSGTVVQVATGNGRDAIYIDLNPKYVELAKQRIGPLLCAGAS